MNPIAGKYLEKNKNINRGYRKLEVWKEAIDSIHSLRRK
jgi:hypothetical protein